MIFQLFVHCKAVIAEAVIADEETTVNVFRS